MWTLSLLAVPVLYLLSVPPVVYWTAKHSGTFRAPPWAESYAEPYLWILQTAPDSPVSAWLYDYLRWWDRKFFPDRAKP
jgi:hypothetical protein